MAELPGAEPGQVALQRLKDGELVESISCSEFLAAGMRDVVERLSVAPSTIFSGWFLSGFFKETELFVSGFGVLEIRLLFAAVFPTSQF